MTEADQTEADQAERDQTEQDLQRRWAESRWPTPFLSTGAGERIRVIAPGRWNHGPGPDFLGAQILDGEGRARRGNVELHLDARAWLQHGHDGDPAYRGLLLHVVERRPQQTARGDPRIPPSTRLPAAMDSASALLPCEDVVERAGGAAVDARLLQIARRRFERKVRELRAISAPQGPGREGDRRCLIAAARALGQPHNAELSEAALRAALCAAADWRAVEPIIEHSGWRIGRGALGSPQGLAQVLTTLLQRWTEEAQTPSGSFRRLASLDPPRAAADLRIEGRLGRGRALQLLADAVYPLTGSWSRWLALPSVRYRRTEELRARLSNSASASARAWRWRHPHSQALLELERTRCRHWACRICPLASLPAR